MQIKIISVIIVNTIIFFKLKKKKITKKEKKIYNRKPKTTEGSSKQLRGVLGSKAKTKTQQQQKPVLNPKSVQEIVFLTHTYLTPILKTANYKKRIIKT